VWTLPLIRGIPAKVFDKPAFDAVNLPGACWNATAGRITFATDFNAVGGDEIWVVKPEGTAAMQVTHHTTSDLYLEPSYSPDGTMIVFEKDLNVANDNDQRASILLVRAVGTSAPTVLVNGLRSNTDNREPNWSRDGRRIVFQRRAPGGQFQLYTIAPNGGGLTRLTNQPADNTDASWSPNGHAVVYSSNYNPQNPNAPLASANLFVIPASGGSPTRLTNQAYYDGAPSWSPDGHWIVVETGVVDPATGDPQLTSIWKIAAPAIAAAGLSINGPQTDRLHSGR
jgi:TolB protein